MSRSVRLESKRKALCAQAGGVLSGKSVTGNLQVYRVQEALIFSGKSPPFNLKPSSSQKEKQFKKYVLQQPTLKQTGYERVCCREYNNR